MLDQTRDHDPRLRVLFESPWLCGIERRITSASTARTAARPPDPGTAPDGAAPPPRRALDREARQVPRIRCELAGWESTRARSGHRGRSDARGHERNWSAMTEGRAGWDRDGTMAVTKRELGARSVDGVRALGDVELA